MDNIFSSKEKKNTLRICFFFIFNLVESRSAKVGGLCVVAVPVGQDHCWMMPRSWQQWTDPNQFHTLTWNVEICSVVRSLHVMAKKTPIAHCGTEWLTESFFVDRWCIHTSTPTSCHMEWREQSDLSSDVAAIFTHGGSCCSNTWFYCDNIMVFQGKCSQWNEILCVKKKKKRNTSEEATTQTEKNVNSVLPIKTIKVYMIVF